MTKKLKRYAFIKKFLMKVPEEPGVYIFYDKTGKIIYIGKAISLKNRLKTYLSRNIFGKTDRLVKNINYFSYIKVGSEIEAILLEAKLIKYHQPYYNIALKDDKSRLYVFITSEKYPRVITGRKSQIKVGYDYSFGPFINSNVFYSILKIVRKILPYSTHIPSTRPCLYHQLGLCNPCPSSIESTDDHKIKSELTAAYKSNIKNLVRFFQGRLIFLKKEFNKKMVFYSKIQEYEKANSYKEKIKYLDILLTPPAALENYTDDPYYINTVRKYEQRDLESILYLHLKRKISVKRIECYDISHIQGNQSAGSMVTFINSSPEKKYYRHFRLKLSKNNDVYSLKEIAERRIKHFNDWGRSDLIVVDGGKTQVNVFNKIFEKYEIPVVGIAKRFERLVIPLSGDKYTQVRLTGNALHLIQRLRDEAHRFAQKYHHLLVNRNLINADKIN